MSKKLLCFVLTLCMLLSFGTMLAFASAPEHAVNGSFEAISGMKPAGWTVRGSSGSTVIVDKAYAQSGNFGLGLKPSGSGVYVSQRLTTILPGKTYTFRGQLRIVSLEGKAAAIKLEIRNANNETLTNVGKSSDKSVADNQWAEVTFNFTTPADASYAILMVRNTSSAGEVHWDEISVTGEGTAATQPAPTDPSTVTTTVTTPADSTAASATPAVPQGPIVQDAEHVVNGNFETVTNGKPSGWTVRGAAGATVITDKAYAQSGNFGLGLKPAGSAVYVSRRLTTILPGKTYTFRGQLRIISLEGKAAAIKLEMRNANGDTLENVGKSFDISTADNKWAEVTFDFTTPAETSYAILMVRNVSTAGEVHWDEISVKGEGVEATQLAPTDPTATAAPSETEEDEKYSPYVPMPATSTELLVNGGFEELNASGSGAKGWTATNGWNAQHEKNNITISKDEVHGGESSVHVWAAGGNPWIKQNIDNPVEGAVYQISTWYKIVSPKANAGFKIEWYGDGEGEEKEYIGGVWVMDPPINTTTEGWEQIAYQFGVPEGCDQVTCYVRVYNKSSDIAPNEVYFDDTSCFILTEPPKTPVELVTDEIFYYSDMFEGIATLTPNYTDFPGIATIEASLKKDGTVLASTTLSPYGAETLEWRFPLGKMVEKDAHTIEIVAKDANGTVLYEPITETIHKYQRPTMMAPDGTILVDGKPFNPVFVYHLNKAQVQKASAVGINVAQASGCDDEIEAMEYLNEAQKYGMKLLIILYAGMKPAGYPDNVERTKRFLDTLKDHPALLGWMVMDEALSHWPGRWDLFYDSYKLIRDNDPVHPVYILQNTPKQYGDIAKYADILAYDPYPNTSRNLSQHVANYTEMAVESVHYEKPVWSLNKANSSLLVADPEKPTTRPLMTIMQTRNMWYQALMADASAVGIYSYTDAITSPKTPLHNTPLYAGLEEFHKAEQGESYDFFLNHKYPVFAESRGADEWHSAYVKDGKVRIIVVNRFEEERTVSIPLTSDNGAVTIGAFTAERIYGGSETLSGDGTLNITLEPSAAYVYEITPAEDVDLSSFKTTLFHDLDTHPWAAQEIRDMEALGIIRGTSESAFMPGKNITRAEFAEFLINTLGLSSDSTEIFADVNPDAPYAKAIAIGKALGVLKGVGGDAYNPNAEISRQDMMVICARGMRLVNKLAADGAASAVDAFADRTQIADYAMQDVSAMVQDGIIKGNADGTINPLGNATRAEAALIMYRIYNK